MITQVRHGLSRPHRSGRHGPEGHARPTSGATPTSSWPAVFEKTEAVAKVMDECGFDTLWLAEHHFQHEGYECMPEPPDAGRAPGARDRAAAHRLRLQHRADVAPAAAGRGLRHRRHPHQGPHHLRRRPRLSHARGRDLRRAHAGRARPTASCSRSRSRSSSRPSSRSRFSHQGKHYTLPPAVPYRGYELRELTLVPRPVNRPVECWQPIVSAKRARARLHGAPRHQGRRSAAARPPWPRARSTAYREAAARAGQAS